MHNIFRALLKSQMRQIVWRNEASVCDSVDDLSFAYARQHVRACARVCVSVCARVAMGVCIYTCASTAGWPYVAALVYTSHSCTYACCLRHALMRITVYISRMSTARSYGYGGR